MSSNAGPAGVRCKGKREKGSVSVTAAVICSLREWMNKTMYEELFDDTEKTRVILSAVSSETSAKTLANGNDTQDHLFLLSYDEVVEYMSLIPSPAVTPYAASLKQSASKESEFWLRTMADTGYPYRRGGDEFYYKTETTYYIGIRPAFWFDMSSQEAASQQEAGE